MKTKCLLPWLVLVLIPSSIQAQAPRVALADFENKTGETELDRYSTGLSDAIATSIARSGMIQVIERRRLRDAIREQMLGQTGALDQESAAQVGRVLGAEAIILGTFLREGGAYQVNARMIDSETSEVLTAAQARSDEILVAADQVAVELLRGLGVEVIETKRSAFKRLGRWVLAGVGGVAGLAAVSAGQQGDDAYDRYLNSVSDREIRKAFGEAEDKDRQRDMLLGVAAASVVSAAILHLAGRSPEREYRPIEAAGGQNLSWRFDRRGRVIVALRYGF